jgi:hypothetical protein
MGDAPASRIALRFAAPVPDPAALVAAARVAGGVDRAAPIGAGGAVEVHWGGRLQRAAVRAVEDDDGAPLIRTEVALAGDGLVEGMARQSALVSALAAAAPTGSVLGVRDLSARVDHDPSWLVRLAARGATPTDAVSTAVVAAEGRAPGWVRTHGAARFGVPDLELYGLAAGSEEEAVATLGLVVGVLLTGGMAARLSLRDGTPVRLVPVLEAWSRLPLDWPGIGRAGAIRGPGLDGPRATLSVLHGARLGRHRLDLAGVVERISPR